MRLQPLNAAITRETYKGAKAATYDRDREHEDKWRREHAAVAEFLKGAQGTVLDIPVGTGRFLPLYAMMGLPFLGMDVSDDMMRKARCKVDGADIFHGDIFAIPLANNAVQTAVCIRLLNLMTQNEMKAAMLELGRVASRRIILSIRTGDSVHRQHRSWTHTHAAFDHIVKAIGMRAVAERPAGKAGYRVVMLQR